MEMLVGIDVIQPKSGGGKGVELGLDLRGELARTVGKKNIAAPARAMSVRK